MVNKITVGVIIVRPERRMTWVGSERMARGNPFFVIR